MKGEGQKRIRKQWVERKQDFERLRQARKFGEGGQRTSRLEESIPPRRRFRSSWPEEPGGYWRHGPLSCRFGIGECGRCGKARGSCLR